MQVGQGTYNNVYKALDRDTQEIVALKKVKCYMHQLLPGLQHCHDMGILHRVINGSNLLFDKNGMLQIVDFGLANFYGPDYHEPLTSRVMTLWYRVLELLLGDTDYGVGDNLWSSECLLAEMFKGFPIMPSRNERASSLFALVLARVCRKGLRVQVRRRPGEGATWLLRFTVKFLKRDLESYHYDTRIGGCVLRFLDLGFFLKGFKLGKCCGSDARGLWFGPRYTTNLSWETPPIPFIHEIPHQSFICILRSQHQNENFAKELCIPCQSQLHQEPLAININLRQPLTREKGLLLKFLKSSSISFFISIRENFSGRSSFSGDPLNFGDFLAPGTLFNGVYDVPTPTFLSSILSVTGAIGFWVCFGVFLHVSRVATATLGF
ncbi:serine/threonine-protein kinase [Vigna angularis]|uniref:Serine/threonine-protein kinase n=1 Tax=Phaseolus angularis TaxID=3914 RepID=A0A8T0JZ64_PHAAN|nr:serine/threonine-protein kinase [Vigna angularis]